MTVAQSQKLEHTTAEASELAAIIALSPDAVFSTSVDGIILTWNPGAEAMFGYPASEAIGHHAGELIIPTDRQGEFASLYTKACRGEIQKIDALHKRRDGTFLDVSVRLAPIRNADGLTIGISAILRDITDEKRAEEALRKSEADLADFFNNATISLHWVGPDGIILRANKAELALLGYEKDEYVGRHISEFHCSRATIDDILTRLARGDKLRDYEAELRCKDGSAKSVLIDSSVRFDENGQFLHTRCFTRDITESKRSAIDLRDSQGTLALGIAVAGLGLGKIDYLNDTISLDEGAAGLFQLPANHPIARSQVHARFHTADKSELEGAIAAALKPAGGGFMSIDHRIVLPDGTVRWLSARKQIHFEIGPSGELRAHSGLLAVRDITESKQVAAALANSEAEFRAAFEQSAVGKAQISADTRRFFRVNGKFCEITGYSAGELAAMTPSDLNFAQDRDADAKVIGQLLRGEIAFHDAEKRYVRKDGKIIWVRVNVTLLRDAEGRPQRTMAVIQDVTGRIEAEDALRESEERYRAATAAASDVMWTNNADGLMTGEQRGWGEFTGQSREQYQGYGWSKAVHPDDAQPTIDAWNQAVAEKRAFVFEHRVRRHDSEWRVCSIRAVPVLNADGTIREWVGVHADITERKQAEERLRRSEEFARMILEANPDCLKVIGADGRMEFVNQNGACLLEVDDCDAIVGKPWETLWPDTAKQMIREAMEAARRGQQVSLTVAAPTQKGIAKHWDISIVPLPSTNAKQVRLLASLRDVTERINSEIALRQSEARFRGTFENAAVGVAHVALDGGWLSVNNKLCSIVGYSREELLTKTFQDITHPDDLDADLLQLRQVLSGELSTYAMDKRYIRKDASVVWIGLTVSVQRHENGAPAYFIFIVRDISERVEATDRLRLSEERYRALVAASDTIVWRTTASGEVVFATDLWSEITGQTDQQKTGWGWLDAIHPDDRDRTVELWQQSLQSRTLHKNEFRVRLANGTFRWFGVRAVPILNEDGTVREWMGANTDIHERKQAEERLQGSYETYLKLIQDAPFGIYLIDADFRLAQMSSGALNVFSGINPSLGRDFADILRVVWPESFASDAVAKFRHTLETGEPFHSANTTEKRNDLGETELYDWQLQRVTLPDGRYGVVCYFYDLTERLRYEEHIRLLMGEVNHRSKNLLGVIQAVARQTAKSGDAKTFVTRLSDRIAGLAQSQDLLVRNEWRGIEVAALVRAQLGAFLNLIDNRIIIDGPAVQLNPAAAQAVGMALHELATNAAKYGALSNDVGRVHIFWQIDQSKNGTFFMSWTESGGPEVLPPTRSGFGHTVLVKMAEAAVSGIAEIIYHKHGVSWHLRAPLGSSLEATNRNMTEQAIRW